jgi:alkaline phosphatase D
LFRQLFRKNLTFLTFVFYNVPSYSWQKNQKTEKILEKLNKMRKILVWFWILVGLSLSVAAQQSPPNSSSWLRSGPMLGYSEMTETVVWLQTRRPVTAQIRFWKRGMPESTRLSRIVKTDEKNDLIARIKLSQLEFGTRYDYEVYLDGWRVPFQHETSFQTQAMWRWRSEPPVFKFAVGSCAYINDTPYDRPGTPYGSGMEVFRAIAANKPDFMIWLGDNIYYREADWLTESGMRYRNAQNRELPELQPLFASTHHYAIWDDHDYGSNDSDKTFRLKDTALQVFKDYWANNTYGTAETAGVFGRFEWGDVEFFLLDDRYHRSPNDVPDNAPEKVMFGEAQMKWLMESLLNSKATFKIIAGGNQMLSPVISFEAFNKFPAEQKKLLDFIREAKIEGVLFLSGDRHLTELVKRTDLGTYPLYDFTSSPLTSGNYNPKGKAAENPARVPNTLVTEVKNFGIIEVVGTSKDRKLILRTIDLTGKEWWKHEIPASELKFPK